MNKKLFGTLAFGTLVAGSLAVGGIASCGGEDDPSGDETKGCTSKLDCKAGQTCKEGSCVAVAGCDQADENACGAGQFCSDIGECTECGAAAASCKVIGINGQVGTDIALTAGSTMDLQAVALDSKGSPIYCAEVEFKVGSDSVANGKYTAKAGDTKVTASVKGSSVTCEANLNVSEAAEAGSVAVYVYDDNTGAPVANANIILNDSVTDVVKTDATGKAVVSGVTGDKYTISVIKAGYNYVTFAGVSASTNNIAIPVGARPVTGVKTGGSTGNFSFEPFKEFLKNGQHKDYHAAFMLNSIPLSSLLSFDVDHFIGEFNSLDDCKNNPNAKGCYGLEGMGLDSIINMIGESISIPSAFPLPGGLVVKSKSGSMKDTYSTPAVPGDRIPWGIGLEIGLNDIMGLVPVFMADTLNVKTIVEAVLPLLSKFGSAVGTVASMPEAAESSWTKQDASLDEKFRIYREVKVNSLPTDARTNKSTDAIAAVRVSNAKGFGAVVTGIALGADLDANGKIDANTICKDEDCPSGVSGNVAEGSLGMLYAPARGAIKNADDMTIYVTGSVNDVIAADELPTIEQYGALNLYAKVKHGAPANSDSVSASDFVGTAVAETTENMSQGVYKFTPATGADMNVIMVASVNETNPTSTRWIVYTTENELPGIVSSFITTSFEGAMPVFGADTTDHSVAHIAGKLSSGNTFDSLVANNGKNVDSFFENVDSFSVYVPFFAEE